MPVTPLGWRAFLVFRGPGDTCTPKTHADVSAQMLDSRTRSQCPRLVEVRVVAVDAGEAAEDSAGFIIANVFTVVPFDDGPLRLDVSQHADGVNDQYPPGGRDDVRWHVCIVGV